MAYAQDELIDALSDCWLLLRQLNEPENDCMAKTPELVDLMKKHPCLEELDECGSRGMCGIGLGNMGGHAV
jgi:hypothetical protein